MNKKILIADDYFVIMTGVKMILKSYFKKMEIEYAENYDEILQKLSTTNDYSLLILGVNIEGNKKRMISEIKKGISLFKDSCFFKLSSLRNDTVHSGRCRRLS